QIRREIYGSRTPDSDAGKESGVASAARDRVPVATSQAIAGCQRGRRELMPTVVPLIASNTFMTIAWYGHLRFRERPLLLVVVVGWLIAFAEYCFQVPANRIGYGEFTAYRLKIIQEIITLTVFAIFACFYLGEGLRWNYALSFACVLGAVVFAFWPAL